MTNIQLTTETVNQIIYLYTVEGKSSIEIQKILGISKGAILKYLKKHNIVMRPPKVYRKYKLDDNFFEQIENWGEKQSYLFGFIMGDGYNNYKKNTIKITLSIKDLDFLEKINDLIQNRRIKVEKWPSHESTFATMIICSPIISQTLLKLGIGSKKTEECHLPTFLNKENMAHFIRGLIDADGCFSRPKQYIRFTLSGNKFICEELLRYLKDELSVSSGSVYADKRSKIAHELHLFGYYNVKKLYSFLYENATIFLERKKNICDDYYLNTTPPEHAKK